MPNSMKHPEPFLTVRSQYLAPSPGLVALCAGYEAGEWRCNQLAAHLIEWLPEFALTHTEREAIGAHNLVRQLAEAARTIYTTKKLKRRGEPGELLLHIAICQVFDTVPAVTKYYYKDASNDTVKGFDAVHVIVSNSTIELWLGESKFYEDINKAITDAVSSLQQHMGRDYLRGEFAAITNKVDDGWPHATRLKKLLDKNTSLDEVFDRICIPVFLTYESPTIAAHTVITAQFETQFRAEVQANHNIFCQKTLPSVRILLFLLPLKDKKLLMKAFDERLKACQAIA